MWRRGKGNRPFLRPCTGFGKLGRSRYYVFRTYRLRQVQQRLMGHIGYRSVEKYLTSSEMSDIVGMELEGTPMVFRKRTPRLRGQLRFCIKAHFKSTTGAQKAPLASCLRISGDINPPGTIVPGGLLWVDQALTAPEVMPSMYSLELKVNIISSGTVAMTKPAIIAP